MAQLISYVCVRDADGADQWFGPGDSVPEWAVAQIANPAVWDGAAASMAAEPDAGPKRRPRKAATEGA